MFISSLVNFYNSNRNVNNAPTSAVIDDIDLLLTGGR